MVTNITILTKILSKHLRCLSQSGMDAFIGALCSLEASKRCKPIHRKDLEGKTAQEIAEFIIKFYTVTYWKTKVVQALRDINENQIRLDLQKDLKADGVRKKEKKAPKADEADVFYNAPGTSGGAVSPADQKQNAGASQQAGEDIKPKKGRKPKTESNITKKPRVKAQTSGGAAGRKQVKEEQSEKDRKPRERKLSTGDKKHFVIDNRNNLIKLITLVDPILDDLLEKKLLTQEQYDIIRKKGISQNKMRELFDFVRSWGSKDNDRFLAILKNHDPIVIRNLSEKSKNKK